MGGIPNNPFFSKKYGASCNNLIIRTQLFSPNLKVLEKIIIGAILEITATTPVGPCVALYKGEVAGTIISKDLLSLLQCIEKGEQYCATVRNKIGGYCAVTIMTKRDRNN